MSLQDAVERIQTLADALDGVRAAPHEPLNQIKYGVVVNTYVQRGMWGGFSGCEMIETTDAQIVSDFHTPYSGDFGRAVLAMRAYIESFPKAIWGDPTLNAKVITVSSVTFDLMIWQWPGNVQTMGYRFTTTVKYQATI